MNLHTINIRLRDGTHQIVRGTEVLEKDAHCLVIKDSHRIIAWFDWANVVDWYEVAAEGMVG
jgi:hypothetical protein